MGKAAGAGKKKRARRGFSKTGTPLARRIRARDSEQRQALIVEGLALARHLTLGLMRRLPPHIRFDDLYAAAMIGLCEATDRWNPRKGVKFTWYARARIMGAMQDHLRELDPLSRDYRRYQKRVASVAGELAQRLGRLATTEEVMERTGFDPKLFDVIATTAMAARTTVSLSEPAMRDFDLADTDAVPLDEQESTLLANLLEDLPDRLRQVIRLYYWEELLLKEIGQALDVTESRACQLLGEAHQRLRAALADREFKARVAATRPLAAAA